MPRLPRTALALALYACAGAGPSSPPAQAPETVEPSTTALQPARAEPAAAPTPPERSAPAPCGAHGCLLFESPVEAFEHVLAPTCDDYRAIDAAGEDGVILMLEAIARLTTEKASSLVEKNRAQAIDRTVICYGGAIHNDVEPVAGAGSFSFGPALSKRVGGRYVALDLVVPELVRDTKLWRSQPWYDAYDPGAHPEKTLLYSPHDNSYALLFPRSSPP